MATIAKAKFGETHVEVEQENWDVLSVFLSSASQWRKEYAGMDGRLVYHGLDYSSVHVVMQMLGYTGDKAREIFFDLQFLEATALPLLNKVK